AFAYPACLLEQAQLTRRPAAVVLPQHRVWLWHERIVSALAQTFDVDVFTSSSAQHYPSYLRLWLHFERSVVVEIDSIGLTTIAPRPWPPQQNIDYAFVVNLSESPVDCANACILEPRFDGCVDSINLFAVLLD